MSKGCLTVLVIVIGIVVIGAAAVMYYLYAEENSSDVSWKGTTPNVTTIYNKSVATGSVEPRKEIQIKPQVSGIIREIFVEAGDTVSDGDLIARVKVIPDMVSLNNAQNRVERARISMDNAEMDYNRNKALLEQGVIAEAEFQVFEISRRSASEELEAAEENLQIIREGVSKSSGAASTTMVRSTIGGMVLDVPVEEGNSVIETNNFNEGTTICSVADMEDLIFLGNIDESEVEKLSTGMELIVTVGAIENRKFDATLEYISPKGVELNGAIQFEIKAAINLDEGEFIRAGYSANADVVLDKREDVLAIPESVVQYNREQMPFVEYWSSGDWSSKDVELGLSDGIMVEVLSGVAESDSLKLWNQPIKN
ncbi:MAG: efflux RND transporter periplasmic adaptor subunit [Flavobacteriales bacterium]|nr:efflux RND transporter periplasmic adaptor subunit [Flavobacteriales bacterium]